MLDNGNILVLDNGRYHVDMWPPDFSRVIEVNPRTNAVEWEYKEENPVDFCSTWASSAQRLPNGNTLICEADHGRFFEVTPKGEIVWEYTVPFYGSVEGYMLGRSNACHRCHRYGPDYPGLQGKSLDPSKLETWNRLYGPEPLAWGGLPRTALGPAPPTEAQVAVEKGEYQAEREEKKPSVGKPGKEIEKRVHYLGY